MTRIKIILILALISIAAAGYGISHYFAPASKFKSLQVLPVSKSLNDFILENQKGEKFSAADFKGKWSLIFFGFTSCPDMCPLQLQELVKVVRMAKQQKQNQIQAVFISLDPERDSRQKIAAYLAPFDAAIVGLRGANSELAALNKFFEIDYSRSLVLAGSPLTIPAGVGIPAEISSAYLVQHSGRIFIINPGGQYIGSFTQPHKAENIWADLQLIIKR